MPNSGSTTVDLTQLAAQAREAYEQKRIRECLALTKALAQADPGNAEASALLSSVRTDIQRDMDDARNLIQEATGDDEKRKYRKAAEIILRKTLNIDPENEEARSLLQSIRALPPGSKVLTERQDFVERIDLAAEPSERNDLLEHHDVSQRDGVEFIAAPILGRQTTEKKGHRLKLPLALVGIVVIGGALLLTKQSNPGQSSAIASVTQPQPSTDTFNPRTIYSANTPALNPTVSAAAGLTPHNPTTIAAPSSMNPSGPLGSPEPTTADAVPAAQAMGKLAVSSPTAAEIYMNDRYLGSTPITLELPAGRQTLEYRHANLKTVVHHDIKADRTTAASVTFRLTVQINARPWAQVFLEGNSRQSLGQTPLSGVTVPIGGVLVFENPNFPTKSYRVTEKDTAIQVDFP